MTLKHLGDVTKIDGHNVPLTDIVTGGSPCQDLSVAGKRAGLSGERSGLFMEQLRIIKEMRDESTRQLSSGGATVDIRFIQPRYMVWENVPGAFSSNKGEDFRCILEETAKVVCESASIPRPKGGWTPSGCIMGNGWSIAWRVHDAQFWGVPQRRKRIALVADFGGTSAPEILFEREGLSGDSETSRNEGQETPRTIRDNSKETSGTISFQERCGKPGGVKEFLSNTNEQDACPRSEINQFSNSSGGDESYVMQSKVYGISAYSSNAMKSSNPNSGIYEAETTRTLDNNGGNPACNQGGMIVLEGNGSRPSHRGDGYSESDTMYTLNSTEHYAVCVGNGQLDQLRITDKVGALNCMHDQQAIMVTEPSNDTDSNKINLTTYGLDRASFNQGRNALYDFAVEEEKAQPIVARGPGGVLTTQSEPCAQEITKG